ncbi:MAG: DUF5675 family protein, partial [Candidatus Heimdallarchaeaceae archaeon]
DHGTEGILATQDFSCKTLELPWKDNRRQISCIPPGEYKVEIRLSNKYGRIYWVRKVPERTYILIHSGNYAGDRSKGLKTHVMGCILLGKTHGFLGGQRAVLNSRLTVKRFMRLMEYETFQFNVLENFK